MRKLFVPALALFLVAGVALLKAQGTAEEGVTVSKMVFCTEIQDREPVGVAEAFPDTLKKVYCFTHIEGAAQELQISHRWYYQDSLMAEIALPVKSKSWRTWSSKNLVKSWRGNWRVDVVDPDGKVLRSASFTYGEAE